MAEFWGKIEKKISTSQLAGCLRALGAWPNVRGSDLAIFKAGGTKKVGKITGKVRDQLFGVVVCFKFVFSF